MVAQEKDVVSGSSPRPGSDAGDSRTELIQVIHKEGYKVKQDGASPQSENGLPSHGQGSGSQTIDDLLTRMPLGLFHWKMLALIGGGYFAVCAEMMVFIFLSQPLKDEWDLGQLDFPWLPFCTGIASIIGGYATGTISDRYGRRPPFIFGIACLAVFGVASAFAPNYPAFIAIRCGVNAGIGAFEATGFVLLLEVLPCSNRGSLLVVVTLCGALGAVLAAGLAWLVLPSLGWRPLVGFVACPAICLMMGPILWVSESPRYLLAEGKWEHAAEILDKMPGGRGDMNLGQLSPVPSSPHHGSIWGKLGQLWTLELRGRTLSLTLVWFLQATGYWGVTSYLPEYMSTQLGANARLSLLAVFIGELPGIVLAMILVEPSMLGRIRSLQLFSGITVMTLFLFACLPLHAAQAALIVMTYFSMVPLYSLLNTYTPEVYPIHLRSTGLAWMNAVIELPGLLTPFVGATLLGSSLPWLYPVVWGGVFLIQFLLTFTLRFETAGRALQREGAGAYESCGQQRILLQRDSSRSTNQHTVSEAVEIVKC